MNNIKKHGTARSSLVSRVSNEPSIITLVVTSENPAVILLTATGEVFHIVCNVIAAAKFSLVSRSSNEPSSIIQVVTDENQDSICCIGNKLPATKVLQGKPPKTRTQVKISNICSIL